MMTTIRTGLVLALTVAAASATAQMAPATDKAMMVPASAMKKITHCKTMAHDMMMKNATCMKMMKMYSASFGAGTAGSN